jgi:oligopeptide/dipeptide ABC transporter ATP-binding protein
VNAQAAVERTPAAPAPLFEVRDLAVTFRSDGREVAALDGCTLQVGRGETVALVGESGSGKSTLARVAAGIVAPSRGAVLVDGRDLAALQAAERRTARRRIQMVFQDPDSSLNPLHRVASIVAEPLEVAGERDRGRIRSRVQELLQMVRLDVALLDRRPRQLSGGQKQRVAIARALAAAPDLLIADEALSALDVSTQSAIAALLAELQRRLHVAILFISHDLATVRSLADRVAVLYAGRIVETGPCARVLDAPRHPYTQLLVAATPHLAARSLDFALVDTLDALPPVAAAPGACAYLSRCMRRAEPCARTPSLAPIAGAEDHAARCHFRDAPAAPGGAP